jgi:hypothetical protein
MKAIYLISCVALAATPSLFAQLNFFTGMNVTGQLVLSNSVNVLQLAQSAPSSGALAVSVSTNEGLEFQVSARRLQPGAARIMSDPTWHMPFDRSRFTTSPIFDSDRFAATPLMQSSPVISATGILSFSGLTHADQRNANNGNQFSVEPPNPSIAIGNGFVLQGVNNAIQVYTVTGTPLLPRVLSSNELFVLPPAINRTTNARGVFPTDMRVFFDQTMSRFLVVQWAQLRDVFGNLLDQSKEYIAVSQTSDPTANWNIYVMDTTNLPGETGCPCIPDYPQLGADQFGVYLSSNEFGTGSSQFVHASILAISKSSLVSSASMPTLYRFIVPSTNGFGFAIQPANTPPGGSYFLASGGVEYLLSSQAQSATGQSMGLWALTNTGSLSNGNPNLSLIQITVPTLTYTFPDVARQRPGPLPYGSTLFPPGLLEFLDAGDTRILSLSYAGGRLFATLQTATVDETGKQVVGVAYVIISPTFRSAVLSGTVVRQGYLLVSNNNLLRPSIAVNAQSRGAIAFTLVGPDYFPSAAFVLIDNASTGSSIQIASSGVAPEDGFSGYPNNGFPSQGLARWGDYSTAVAANDGSIWMVTEFISNAQRTQLANWATLIAQVQQ